MSAEPDQRYSQLFVRLENRAQLRLDRVPLADAVPGSEEVTITLPSGQVLHQCFWREGAVEAGGALQKNEAKVRRLVRFMHEQPAALGTYYKRLVRWVDARLPRAFARMSPQALVWSNGLLWVLGYVAYQVFGRQALVLLPVAMFYLWLCLLRYTHPDEGVRYDYDAIEVAASSMLGFLPSGRSR